jgi:tRNA(Ile2) C34 agmatinyltransferase TiaS
MSGAGTRIMAAGLVSEGIAFEEMQLQIIELQEQLKSSKPTCPQCLIEMRPISHRGYYESFPCWTCDCEEIEGAVTIKGGYA